MVLGGVLVQVFLADDSLSVGCTAAFEFAVVAVVSDAAGTDVQLFGCFSETHDWLLLTAVCFVSMIESMLL